MITFIIPTIGRLSLTYTIQSLQKLKHPDWRGLILFDGIKNTNWKNISTQEPRISFLEIPKTGEYQPNVFGSRSGLVRQIAIQHILSNSNINENDWIGFVDDDDTLSPFYIDYLNNEIEINPDVEVVLFRMIYRNMIVLPPKETSQFEKGKVGISFCFKTKLLTQYPQLSFQNNSFEDFLFLNQLLQHNCHCIISPHIAYYVKSKYFPVSSLSSFPRINRVIFNEELPGLTDNDNKKIYIETKGGFGNLLFQFFFGFNLSKVLQRPVYFIPSKKPKFPLRDNRPPFHSFSLFNNIPIIDKFHSENIIKFVESEIDANNHLFQPPLINNFIETYKDENSVLLFDGYFQSFSLFESHFDSILAQHFSFPLLKQNINNTSSNQKRKIAVHIRAGDYLIHNSIYYILPNEYYENSLKYVKINKDGDEIYLFTDMNQQYIKENYKWINEYNEIIIWSEQNNNTEKDFIQMSQCEIIILANSTFSLWSSYIGNHNLIIIPNIWFNPQTYFFPISHLLHPHKNYYIQNIDNDNDNDNDNESLIEQEPNKEMDNEQFDFEYH